MSKYAPWYLKGEKGPQHKLNQEENARKVSRVVFSNTSKNFSLRSEPPKEMTNTAWPGKW